MQNLEHWACRQLVTKFIKNPKNWAQEIKLAKTLLCHSPDLDAWLELNLTNSIASLSFFLCKDGVIFRPLSQKNPYLLDLDKLKPRTNKLDVLVN